MTQREEPRRKDVHVQAAKALDQYSSLIRRYADTPQLSSAYEKLPDAVKQGRSLIQMAADDMMDAFAFLMLDVDQKDVPLDYYRSLLELRAPTAKKPSPADALADLEDRTDRVRTSFLSAQEVKALPDFINYTIDKTDPIIAQNLINRWQANLYQMRRLVQTESVLSVQENASILTQLFEETLGARISEVTAQKQEMAQMAADAGANGGGRSLVTAPQAGTGTQLPPKLKALLGGIGEDLVDLARKSALPDTDGREKEAKNVFRILMHKNNTSALIHGAEGVGKSAVVNSMAAMIAKGTAPARMKNAHIYKISLTNMLFNQQAIAPVLKAVAEHNRTSPDKVILHFKDYGFCPDPNLPLRQGIGMLRNLIVHEAASNKGLLLSGEATQQDLFVLEKADANALKNFQRVKVESLSPEETKTLMLKHAVEYKAETGVDVTDEMIDYVIQKADRFMPTQHNPGKASRVIEDAVALCESNGMHALNEETVDAVIAETTKLPLAFVGSSISDSIENLEGNLLTQIFGQDKAVHTVASTIRLVNQNLNDPKKPLGVFYGIGPTGVGKTELAKALARTLFQDEKALITVNLSDFMEKHSVSRILGAPPGYVGYNEKTALEDVNERPFSVILFDEAEKAHGDVDNALMKVMDEGRLTLLNGKELDFRNCVLIFSSNLGASAAEEARGRRRPGFGNNNDDANEAEAGEAVQEAMKSRLKPEFRNRATFIDFNKLTHEVVSLITDKKIREVSARLRENKDYKNLNVTLTPEAKEQLMKLGFDPRYGARPMERAITQSVLVPLGEWLSQQKASGAASGWLTGKFNVSVKDLKTFAAEAVPANSPTPPAPSVPRAA